MSKNQCFRSEAWLEFQIVFDFISVKKIMKFKNYFCEAGH
jgi:hypothetical protein